MTRDPCREGGANKLSDRFSSGKVANEGITFMHLLADIEPLNQAAFNGKYEIKAMSFHAYACLPTNTCCRYQADPAWATTTVPSSSRDRMVSRHWRMLP